MKGKPLTLKVLKHGERVVDVGCGAGLDCLIASKMVGPDGEVIGVDMTTEMLEKARNNAQSVSAKNISFRQGFIEELPVSDNWADVIISNGAINLAPDKDKVFQEIHRILKPDGRLQIADILVDSPLPTSAKQKTELWVGWIAGALLEAELANKISKAGFEGFTITWRGDIFRDAPQQTAAKAFGTMGISYSARKPN